MNSTGVRASTNRWIYATAHSKPAASTSSVMWPLSVGSGCRLANFDQVAVGVADVCADFAAMSFRLGEEVCALR